MNSFFRGIRILAIICLYCVLVVGFLMKIGPILFFVTSLLGAGIGPFLYALVSFNFFNIKIKLKQKPWKWLIVTFGVLLLFHIYLDIVMMLLPFLKFGLIKANLYPLYLEPVNKVPHFYFQMIYKTVHLTANVTTIWRFLLSNLTLAAIKMQLLVSALLIISGCKSRKSDGDQPAFVQYFFHDAFEDLKGFIGSLVVKTVQLFKRLAVYAASLLSGRQAVLIWPIVLSIALALAPATIALVFSLFLMIVIHGIGLLIILLINFTTCFVLIMSERSIIFARSGFAKCPHAGCHRRVPLPYYRCPSCGVTHSRLIPGRYGIFLRTCQCDRGVKLPTLFWFGKRKLPSQCPYCNRPFLEELFADNLHIPIYGGTSTGKTMYMMAATKQLMDQKCSRVSAFLIDPKSRHNYDTLWSKEFDAGKVRDKTSQVLPDAYLLSIKRGLGLPHSVYIYDPAGESLIQQSDLRGHSFLRYMDGMILLIDPLSLNFFQNTKFNASDRPSLTDPIEVINNIVNVLETRAGLNRNKPYGKRLAVVLTKCDITAIRGVFGLEEYYNGDENWEQQGTIESEKIKAWFKKQEVPLLQLLETRFKYIRFFAVSALGHSPAMSGAFSPVNILPPLAWVMARRKGLSWPSFYHIGLRSVEVIVAILIITPAIIGIGASGVLLFRLLWDLI